MSAVRTVPANFGYGPDEALLRDQARKLLGERAGVSQLRARFTDPAAVYQRGELPGYDRALFASCVELGWSALSVPEASDGLGAKLVAISALVEEMGRHALPSPLLSTILSSFVLSQAGSEAGAAWLKRITEGATLSLAISGSKGAWDLDATDVRATRQGEGLVLQGSAHFVQDAFKVDAFLVAARTDQGLCLAVVPKDAAGVSLEREHIVDLTRDQGRLTLTNVSASELVTSDALPVLQRAWPSVLTVVSADLVGESEWLLQTTVEYAKTRKQFERTIGFFQAVKHQLVEAMVQIDLARSHLYHAAATIDAGSEQAEVAARMAKSAASDAAMYTAGRAIQLHGGIGFTWECDVHFFVKRAQHSAILYGDGVHQRKKLAEKLLG
ncbi:MAG TPA: acyl-CoA dehydrogenase family protein [Polyangiales bacterium]